MFFKKYIRKRIQKRLIKYDYKLKEIKINPTRWCLLYLNEIRFLRKKLKNKLLFEKRARISISGRQLGVYDSFCRHIEDNRNNKAENLLWSYHEIVDFIIDYDNLHKGFHKGEIDKLNEMIDVLETELCKYLNIDKNM